MLVRSIITCKSRGSLAAPPAWFICAAAGSEDMLWLSADEVESAIHRGHGISGGKGIYRDVVGCVHTSLNELDNYIIKVRLDIEYASWFLTKCWIESDCV